MVRPRTARLRDVRSPASKLRPFRRARLEVLVDDELARKIEELSRATGKSASSIIKAALEAYIESVL